MSTAIYKCELLIRPTGMWFRLLYIVLSSTNLIAVLLSLVSLTTDFEDLIIIINKNQELKYLLKDILEPQKFTKTNAWNIGLRTL